MKYFSLALLGLLLSFLGLIAQGQEACFGHGTIVDGKCVCSFPLPDEAFPGWVGDQCTTPVHHLYLDGHDVQETCGAGHVCNVVTPTEHVCFATSIEEMAGASFHMSLLLTSTSAEAAVTLKGLLTNFSEADGAGGKRLVPEMYPASGVVYSFSMHTTIEATTTQLHLTRRQLGYGAYTGLYLCAESTATTTISLRGATHSCPFTLKPNGTLDLCSGRGTTDTCPHGSCSCPMNYVPPPNWVMVPGLGFEDCSATLQPLQLASPQLVAGLAPGAWSFFSVDWPADSGYELRTAAAAMEATRGQLALFLRHMLLPSESEGQHELSSEGGPEARSWSRDLSAHLTLRRTEAAFRPGLWYLGVYNKGSGPVVYNLTASLYDCPGGCSGRGTCAPDTATCTCSQPTMLAPDCAVSSLELTPNQPLTLEPRDLPRDVLVLRGVPDVLRAAGASQLVVTASFFTSDEDPPGLPAWVTGRPLLLVSPTVAALSNTSSGDPAAAVVDGQVARLALAAPGAQYSLVLGPWMVADDGSLHLLFWNPLTGPQRHVGYSITVATRASCPSYCSGHGTCDDATGKCTCQAPYVGGDCSVDASVTAACAPGSRQPVHRDDLRGTCWAACKADGSGYDEGGCDELTCDGPGEGHGQLRRKGAELACVEDSCSAGDHTVMDPSGDLVCTKRCVCPEDGGPCAMAADCLPGSEACLRGKQLDPGSKTCIPAACVEGSMQRRYDIAGGTVLAVCVCATPGNPASCAFNTPNPSAGSLGGVVSCNPGFVRQGASGSVSLPDGTVVATGGWCGTPPRRGVRGGMVFFYCLLSIFLAAGLVVGGKYGLLWYEQYRYGRSVFSEGYVAWPLFGGRGHGAGGTDDW